MIVSNIKAILPYDVKRVWDIVTSLTDYSWRSDVSRITSLSEKQFREHAKNGFPTDFTITGEETCRRWEFDMENSNMKGHWLGLFSCQDGITTVDFTESIMVKKIWLKPFASIYLKKQQSAYIRDLKKALESQT